jgi:HEAT repeat protein
MKAAMPLPCRARRLAARGLLLSAVALFPACSLTGGRAAHSTAAADPTNATVARLLHSAAAQDDHDAALEAIAALGPAALPGLSTGLADPEENVRLVAVEGLGKMHGPAAVDKLLVALRDTSADVRLSAVEQLGGLGDRRAVQPLLDQFARDENPQVRYECLTSLGLIGDPSTADFLVKCTSASDPFVRLWAMDALCQMNDRHAQDLALGFLRDPNPAVRDQIIRACADAFNTPNGRRALIELALDLPDFSTAVWARRHLTGFVERGPNGAQLAAQIRAAALPALHGPHALGAAMLLGDLGDRAATERLIAALRDPDFLVRHHAALLLARLRDRRAVPALTVALNDNVGIVGASAYNSLQWFADDGDPRAQEAVRNYKGMKFNTRLPR